MEGFVKGDIVVVDFPFSNQVNAKRRPVLVIKVPSGDDIIVCQMTGQSYEKPVEIQIKKEDLHQGKLSREGFVRLDKIVSLEKSLVNYRAASLKQEKFNEILDKLCNFLRS